MDTSNEDKLLKNYKDNICSVCLYKGTDCIKAICIEEKHRSVSIKCDGYKHS